MLHFLSIFYTFFYAQMTSVYFDWIKIQANILNDQLGL